MRAIKAARQLIETDPQLPAAKVFADLVLTLETDIPFRPYLAPRRRPA